ncbi:hypothetical protein XENTR_v10022064 [Xenopus tropicalis]|nr:hypothetical protein XENTR_v10022064 [Xenopus tropicalis]
MGVSANSQPETEPSEGVGSGCTHSQPADVPVISYAAESETDSGKVETNPAAGGTGTKTSTNKMAATCDHRQLSVAG